jgi:hypothetical protein
MHPGWEKDLHRKMAGDPPCLVLDSDDMFDSEEIRKKLGLKYELVKQFPGEFKLFALRGRSQHTLSVATKGTDEKMSMSICPTA